MFICIALTQTMCCEQTYMDHIHMCTSTDGDAAVVAEVEEHRFETYTYEYEANESHARTKDRYMRG